MIRTRRTLSSASCAAPGAGEPQDCNRTHPYPVIIPSWNAMLPTPGVGAADPGRGHWNAPLSNGTALLPGQGCWTMTRPNVNRRPFVNSWTLRQHLLEIRRRQQADGWRLLTIIRWIVRRVA